MNLDINTPRGREAAQDQSDAIDIVFGSNLLTDFIPTNDRGPARVDGIITHKGSIYGVAEIKSRRDMNLVMLMEQRSGEWLLTYDKLIDICSASRLFGAMGFGMLYLPADEAVIMVSLTNSVGDVLCKHRIASTVTQATCNGGSAVRKNAFINVFNSRVWIRTYGNSPLDMRSALSLCHSSQPSKSTRSCCSL